MSSSSTTEADLLISPCRALFNSSIGRKFVMAATGVLLLLFIIGHLAGNLQIFLGQEVFNSYAAFLRSLGGLLWVARIGLLAILFMHLLTAAQLRRINRAARNIGYNRQATLKASAASLYMAETGVVILIFLIIHLLHFTFMYFHPEFAELHDAKGRHDTYTMVVSGFQNGTFAALYIFSVSMLGMHLSHGIGSAFHTLGFYHSYFQPRIRAMSNLIGYGIALGYLIIPVAVQLGLVGL